MRAFLLQLLRSNVYLHFSNFNFQELLFAAPSAFSTQSPVFHLWHVQMLQDVGEKRKNVDCDRCGKAFGEGISEDN